jgi:acyl-CoA dehydrogenase
VVSARRLTHDQFRASVAQFVTRELRPRAAGWENAGRFPRSALVECARRGYFELKPEQSAVLAEELTTCESLGFALSVFVQANLVAPLIRELGTEVQKRRFEQPLLDGQMFGCVAVSEPAAGSDFAALESTARRDRGQLVLNGCKSYITNAAIADFAVTAVRMSKHDPGQLTLVLVPLHSKGVRVQRLRTLGLVTSGMGMIEYRNCRVPLASILGREDEGFSYIQSALNRERLLGGIAAVAWAQYALQKTVQFARERRAFGRAIGHFQAVRHQLAEATAQLEAARQLNYATYARWIQNEDVTREICIIKLVAYQAAQDAITTCLQLHGGLGYLDTHWMSRFYRDARALTIAAGTPEIMKEMIAAYLRI